MRIKVTLSGQGGELDCRVVVVREGEDDESTVIRAAVQDIVLNCELAIGDTIKIEELLE